VQLHASPPPLFLSLIILNHNARQTLPLNEEIKRHSNAEIPYIAATRIVTSRFTDITIFIKLDGYASIVRTCHV